MAYRLLVRTGGKVRTLDAATLAEGMMLLESEVRAAASSARPAAVDLRYRRFDPAEQVAARIELSGPGRWRPLVRVGMDVRGDGTLEAWSGRVGRAPLEPAEGESPFDALRRSVGVA